MEAGTSTASYNKLMLFSSTPVWQINTHMVAMVWFHRDLLIGINMSSYRSWLECRPQASEQCLFPTHIDIMML